MALSRIQSPAIEDATITAGDLATGAARANFGPVAAGDLAAGAARANFGAGAVLQVVQTIKTDTFTTTSTGFVDVGGLSVTITPASTNSRVLILITCAIGMGSATAGTARLVRNGTVVFVGDNNAGYVQCSSPSFYGGSNDGNNNEQLAISYVDSPSTTSAVTYKLQVASPQGGALWVNTLGSNIGNQVYSTRSAASIIAMEIAG